MAFDAQIIHSINLYQLDECGRIPATGNVVLRSLEKALKSVAWVRSVDLGAQTAERLANGQTCPPPPSVPIDNGFDFTFNLCGQNRVLEAMAGYVQLLMTSTVVTGYTASKMVAGKSIAADIIFKPYGDEACTGATPQYLGIFIPKLGQFSLTGGQTVDGNSRADAGLTARTFTNSRVFDLFTTGAMIPTELAHWTSKRAEIVSGDDWYVAHYMNAPTLETGTPNVLDALVP